MELEEIHEQWDKQILLYGVNVLPTLLHKQRLSNNQFGQLLWSYCASRTHLTSIVLLQFLLRTNDFQQQLAMDAIWNDLFQMVLQDPSKYCKSAILASAYMIQ